MWTGDLPSLFSKLSDRIEEEINIQLEGEPKETKMFCHFTKIFVLFFTLLLNYMK